MFPSKSFVFSMLTFAQKYSMSGSVEIREFSMNILPMLFTWPRRSFAVPLAMVVMIGFPFLDQLTAMAWKYVGTSNSSKRVLISLQAMLAFLHLVSGMCGLNCSMRWWGLALGLGGMFSCNCCGLDVVFWVGLITVGFANLTHLGAGDVLAWGAICLEGGGSVIS